MNGHRPHLLAIFEILGTNYKKFDIFNYYSENANTSIDFTKIDFRYEKAVGSIKVGDGIKSEG